MSSRCFASNTMSNNYDQERKALRLSVGEQKMRSRRHCETGVFQGCCKKFDSSEKIHRPGKPGNSDTACRQTASVRIPRAKGRQDGALLIVMPIHALLYFREALMTIGWQKARPAILLAAHGMRGISGAAAGRASPAGLENRPRPCRDLENPLRAGRYLLFSCIDPSQPGFRGFSRIFRIRSIIHVDAGSSGFSDSAF